MAANCTTAFLPSHEMVKSTGTMAARKEVLRELKSLVVMRKSTRKWQIPVLTAICVGFPLLIGLYFQAMGPAILASLSGMVILYLPDGGSLTSRITTLMIGSFGFLVSFALGQFFSFDRGVAVLALGLFSLVVHWIILYYKAAPPGGFFFIMIAALSICQPYDLEGIPQRIGLLAMGLMFSSAVALAYLLRLSTRIDLDRQPRTQSIFKKNKAADFWEAIIMGVFMALSLAVGHLMDLVNPYWIPISCAAVMQGASRYHIWQRTFQRILGTFLGLGLCWGLLSLSSSMVMLCAYIILLQLIVETLVVRNYALAVIFITPLAIFFTEAADPLINSPDMLVELRLKETVIGSVLGALGGWLLHREKLRFATIRGIRIINYEIGRRRR